MPVYAQLDDNGICMAIVDTSGVMEETDKIKAVGRYDTSVLGKRYEKGEWLEVEQPAIEPEITNAEIKENQLVIMAAIADLFELVGGGV